MLVHLLRAVRFNIFETVGKQNTVRLTHDVFWHAEVMQIRPEWHAKLPDFAGKNTCNLLAETPTIALRKTCNYRQKHPHSQINVPAERRQNHQQLQTILLSYRRLNQLPIAGKLNCILQVKLTATCCLKYEQSCVFRVRCLLRRCKWIYLFLQTNN